MAKDDKTGAEDDIEAMQVAINEVLEALKPLNREANRRRATRPEVTDSRARIPRLLDVARGRRGEGLGPAMTCAICASAKGPFTREPLGRNDAMVSVCADCSSGAPVVRRGPDRGYEVREGVSTLEMRRRASKIVPRGAVTYASSSVAAKPKTFGFVVERVVRRQDGKTLDQHDAERIVRAMPWGSQARYLGTDLDFFLFERPPEVSLSSDVDILEDLRRLEGKGR
jgi:hypothetical protein